MIRPCSLGRRLSTTRRFYRLNDELALVQTVDFFTPVVDDPYDFGRIAAAKRVLRRLCHGWPTAHGPQHRLLSLGVLPLEYLASILQGGAEIARQAGATIVGGHTIDDPEPKYGLAVTGIVRPGEQLTNAGARVGDLLVLTKPLGTGIIATAIKQGKASPEAIAAATASMATLNKDGADVARAYGAHALTDITGFGLLGHLTEMCRAAGVAAEVWLDRLPLLPQAVELAREGVIPGGTRRNFEFVEAWTTFDSALEAWQRLLCCDAQTSGGLLLCIPADRAEDVLKALTARQAAAAAVVGRVMQSGGALLEVRRNGPAA